MDAVYELDEGGHGAVCDDSGPEAEDAPSEGCEIAGDESELNDDSAEAREVCLFFIGLVEAALYVADAVVDEGEAFEGTEERAVFESFLKGDVHIAFFFADVGGELALAFKVEFAGKDTEGHYYYRGEGEIGIEEGEEDEGSEELHDHDDEVGELG